MASVQVDVPSEMIPDQNGSADDTEPEDECSTSHISKDVDGYSQQRVGAYEKATGRFHMVSWIDFRDLKHFERY